MHLNIRPKHLLLTLILMLLVAACNQDAPEGGEEPAPTAEVNQSRVQFVPFLDDALGLTVQYPANWISHTSISGVTFASSQAAIDAESLADIGSDGFIVIIPGEIDYFNFQTSQTFTEDDVLSALATYKALLEREGQQYVTLQPPESFSDNNYKMARMLLRSVEDGEPVITVMSVVMGNGYMALISAASLEETAEEMRPLFYRIIESIEVRPPAGLSTDE